MDPNLFDKAISNVPRTRAWMFSSVEHRDDGDFVVAHTQALRHVARVEPRDVGGVGRRHHHGAHAVGAERIDGNRQHQRRIDSAAQPDDGAREAVLDYVVAHTDHQRGPCLCLDGRHGDDFAAHLRCTHVDEGQCLFEHRRTRRNCSLRVDGERSAVEHNLVLGADQMRIQQRHGQAARPLGHALFALADLAQVEGRGIQHTQHLGAGRLGTSPRLVEPGVFADQDAEADAVDVDDDTALAGVAARGEIAPLVEDLVVRQLALAIGRDDPPPRQNRGRVGALLHGMRLRPNIAALAKLMRMPHHHEQPRQIGQLLRAVVQRLGAGLHEGRSQQQVFGRVAAQAEFGCQHQTRTLRVRATGTFDDLAAVAGQIANRGIDLRQGYFHRGWC